MMEQIKLPHRKYIFQLHARHLKHVSETTPRWVAHWAFEKKKLLHDFDVLASLPSIFSQRPLIGCGGILSRICLPLRHRKLAPTQKTALCRSHQQCVVLAIVLQYFIRAFVLEYKVLHKLSANVSECFTMQWYKCSKQNWVCSNALRCVSSCPRLHQNP